MNPEIVGILTLILYFAVALSIMIYQAMHLRDGWRAWVLFVIARVYAPLLWGIKTNRRCPFPGDSAAIVIANHRSPADPLILWYNSHLGNPQKKMRCIHFLMAREYYELPGIVGWIAKAMHSIPVDRDGRDVVPVRETLRQLKQGDLIGVFPEGGIQDERAIAHANSGIAFLALRSKAPVYPVYINQSPRGKNMIAPFYTFSDTSLVYGDPIDLSGYYDRRASRDVLEEVTTLMMQRLAELGNTTYLGSPVAEKNEGLIQMPAENYRSAN